ncbi:MAG: hypothetical protein H0W55_02105 [Actinobacteria bacterium]|nr:hypothetical protein [Actinomycetota bacterium]MDQ3532213.1 hypothetical protein [Actinomycetota bacterium]
MELDLARKRVCDVLDAPRSTIYARDKARPLSDDGVVVAFPKRGPKTELSDDELLVLIHQDQRLTLRGRGTPQGDGPSAASTTFT